MRRLPVASFRARCQICAPVPRFLPRKRAEIICFWHMIQGHFPLPNLPPLQRKGALTEAANHFGIDRAYMPRKPVVLVGFSVCLHFGSSCLRLPLVPELATGLSLRDNCERGKTVRKSHSRNSGEASEGLETRPSGVLALINPATEFQQSSEAYRRNLTVLPDRGRFGDRGVL
jgi:hypothetical protein